MPGETFTSTAAAIVAAYNARDIAAFVAFFHERALVYSCHNGAGIPVCRNRAELKEYFEQIFATCPDLHEEVLQTIGTCGNVVTHSVEVTGREQGKTIKATIVYEFDTSFKVTSIIIHRAKS
ncbi:nuclear transport factor 2 family protein [bacterium]|nr:nuclear transport factor 2 family protein [bacterium]